MYSSLLVIYLNVFRYREICGVDGGRKVRSFEDLSSNISREVT